MPRSPRLEYADAVYHVTARGMLQRAIFLDDADRIALLTLLAEELASHDARLFAYCLMGNHYHLVLQTRRANLSALMQRINGRYGSAFNLRHGRRGHVFDGRFRARHVDRDAYLLQACRYVELNPVRAVVVERPEQWRWSSYRSRVGLRRSPEWLTTDELHAALTGQTPRNVDELASAQRHYAEWVAAGVEERLWSFALRGGLYLGDEAFVERVNRLAG